MRHYIVKAIIASVLIFVGVGGGIYVGTAFSNRSIFNDTSPGGLSNNSYLEIGSKFPDYTLVDHKTGQELSISNLTVQKPTLLFFLSTSCDVCYKLSDYVKSSIIPNLRDDIQIAIIFDSTEIANVKSIPDALIFPGSKIFVTDRRSQNLDDGINIMPSVVGLYVDRKIRFIMSGYNRKINAGFINEIL